MSLKRNRKVADLGSGSEESEPELVDLEPQALDMASDLGNLDSGAAEGDYGWHQIEYEDSSDRIFRFHRLPSGSLPESDTGLDDGMPADTGAATDPIFDSKQPGTSAQASQQLASNLKSGNKTITKASTASAGKKSQGQGRPKKPKVEPKFVAPQFPSQEPQTETGIPQQISSDSFAPEYDWEFATRSRHMDITAHLLDEIALEGLDGITLQGLFLRLQRRKELNNMLIDDLTKEYLWNYAKKLKCIRIYLLSEARADLRVYNRLDHMDERGNLYEPTDAPEDIYEYFPIDDKKLGIRGSCKEYYKRTPFKSTARKMSYKQIEARFPNKVVLMAPQYIRERAIIPPHIDLANEDLNVLQYCILERTARAREQGEMTRGKVSLNVMKIDAKSLHYQRRLLIKKGILKKQPLNMKYGPQRSTAAITLLHIPRFFTFFETALVIAARGAIKKINESSTRMCETAKLKAIYGKHMVRSFLSQEYSMIFEQQDQTYASMDPGAYLVETSSNARDMMVKRKVKVITLKHPQLDHTNFMQLLPVNEEKDDDEPEQAAIFSEFSYPWNASILVNFIRLVYEARVHGASINELATAHSISTLDARTGCRLLQRLKLAVPVLEDKKKTKLNKYVFVKFQKANRVAQNVDVSKAPVGFTPNPLVVQTQPEPVKGKGISSRVTRVTTVDPDPTDYSGDDISEVPCTSTSSTAPSNSRAKQTSSATKLSINETVQEKVPSTCASIPSGLMSMTPLMLNPTLVNMAKTFVLDAKEHDIVEPVRYHELRFTDGEARDFRPYDVEVKDTLTYESPSGWEVCIEPADLLVRIPKRSVIFNTERSVNRGNIIMEYIYKHRVILGFQQILREVRTTEARLFWEHNDSLLTNEKPEDVDRRSLFRILKQLEIEQRIRMWRVTLQKQKVTRIVAFFTPFAVVSDSRLMRSAVELLIQAVLCRVKLTREQKKAKRRKEALLKKVKPPKKVKRKPVLTKQDVKVTKTSAKAKPGAKQGTDYTPNLDRFVTMAVTGSVPLKRKRRIIAQKLNRRILMDEVDKAALSILTRRRVEWEPEEDCCLLCLFIASVIFIPRYNASRVFMFNAPQVRDILHSKVPISISKTTVAVRRRLHFLMKSDSYYCRYRYYLSEALNDETLMKNYVSDHRIKAGHKIFYDIPNESLTAVYDYLFNKFQTLKSRDGSDLLYFDHGNSVEQKYNIEQKPAIKPVKGKGKKGKASELPVPVPVSSSSSPRKTDVIRIVSENTGRHTSIINAATHPFQEYSVDMWLCRTTLLSLIQSGELTHQIQKFVECLPGNVLDMCVHNLKKIGIMAWSKKTQKFGISVPLKKRLNSDISPAKFQEAYQCIREIRRNAGRQIMFDSSEFENLGSFIVLCELGMRSLVELEIELPDPIITVNDEWNEIFAGLCDSSSSDEEYYAPKSSTGHRANTYTNWRVDANAKKEAKPRRRSTRNLESMNLKRQNTKDKLPEQSRTKSKSNITAVFSNVVSGQTALHNALQSKSTVANSAKILRVSNKALRLIRSQISVSETETASFVERDFFTVNIPKINVWFPGEPALDRAVYGGRRRTGDISYLENHLIKFLPYNSSAMTEGQPASDTMDYGRFTLLYNLIHTAGPVGLSVVYLLTKFTRESVREGLSYLVHKNLILLVGITYKKYVSYENVTKWAMPIPKEDDTFTAPLRVIMRPWIRANGTLNFIFLDQCFVAIIGYIKTLPCLAIRELSNHMRPMLSPVETMLLVEAMAHFNLITLFKLECDRQISLFSEPSRLIQEFNVDVMLDMEFLYSQLQPLITVKYSELQDQMYYAAGGPPDCTEEVENIVEYHADPHNQEEANVDDATD